METRISNWVVLASVILSYWLFVVPASAGSCGAAKLCCQGRDSGCVIQKASPNAIIESPRDKPCYCDHACLRLGDCCDDFNETCAGRLSVTMIDWEEKAFGGYCVVFSAVLCDENVFFFFLYNRDLLLFVHE